MIMLLTERVSTNHLSNCLFVPYPKIFSVQRVGCVVHKSQEIEVKNFFWTIWLQLVVHYLVL